MRLLTSGPIQEPSLVCVSVCARVCFVGGKDQAQTQAKIIVPDGKKNTNALAETSLLWLSPALGG